ncbi:SusD/RagB family nutrient-binding outer membrane lipoprotein [Zobellia amurskyensis]|uniref:SusD/RagB family nutrient-binding outer membrane lipoprotein n=1 Tax=Zobellia amurskyensis TaxID=248905 RepID=A0A7X2ZRV5_9FLAO|nr:SusD/RagB family nutrient-binding outer membrane lipoprotein [Zobellia amurskyensis]MUH35235.1 SusD/RagB family nutrient-binding outer membrane lipoprotein [Zobellia amurskyensis]
MKNIIYRLLSLTILLAVFSCDRNFDEINTNTVDPTSENVDPIFLLNNAIINTSFSNAQIVYDMGLVQQIVTPNSGFLTGANYNQDNRVVTDDHWVKYYENVIKNTGDIIGQLEAEGAPDRPNLLHMTRLIQALTFMILTDEYGDIPYFEAGKGVTEQIVLPRYDTQEVIYSDLIKEVKEAVDGLDEGESSENGEVLYSGDISKWKRFGNSLLLRLGMRLTEVNASLAEQTVMDAYNGGLMQSNEDNYVVRHDSNFTNGAGNFLNASEANNFYLVDTFVDFLSDTNDPRLMSLALRFVGATSGPEQVIESGSKDPAEQVGMPMGYDNGTIGTVVNDLGLASFYDFTQVDRYRIVKQTAPMYIITYSQTQLLLAEAAIRGWVNVNPEELYNEGVTAHMELMAEYDESVAIETADINAYLIENPFDANNAIEQINNQYWVSCFLNGPEAFANFRRSGFPDLQSNPYPAQDISTDFVNRLTYPNSELAANNENLSAAVSQMGPDNLETKVWWDQ